MNRDKSCNADRQTPTCGAAEKKKNEREKGLINNTRIT